ncbi:hypothetical protein H1R20_g12725, partial [Candolleomyces eurysporus]
MSTHHGTATVEDVDENGPLDEDKPAAKKLKTKKTTTLCQHIQASHQGSYNAWCKRNGAELKLPAAVRARKDAKKAQQSTLDDVVEEKERVVPYSDTLFQEVAEDWLIATNQFADQAQQAFSSKTEPSLYNGLPVLERLHKAWTSCSKEKYKQYRPALEASLAKIKDYYNKTSYSHMYTMAMKALGQQA